MTELPYDPIPSSSVAHYSQQNLDIPGHFHSIKIAGWWIRVLCFALNVAGPYWLLVGHSTGSTQAVMGDVFWIYVVANSVVAQGLTGQTWAGVLLGIKVAHRVTDDGATQEFFRPGVFRMAFRGVLHLLDILVLFYGVFRPLVERYHRTFADQLTSTIVIRDRNFIFNTKDGSS